MNAYTIIKVLMSQIFKNYIEYKMQWSCCLRFASCFVSIDYSAWSK